MRLMWTLRLGLVASVAVGWGGPADAGRKSLAKEPRPLPALQLAESFPVETPFDDPEIGPADQLWIDLIGRAQRTVDLSQFYLSPREGEGPDRLRGVITMLEVAAKRGVQVRMLMDAKFQKTYPAELARLDALPNVDVQLLDVGKLTGGVQHAKYFVVDGQIGWLGSQNFDWRSLDHIHEIGVAFTEPQAVSALQAVFNADWARTRGDATVPTTADPVKGQPVAVQYEGAEAQVLLVASPARLNPPGVATELPALISAIDAAKTAVNVQVMSYALVGYDKVYWDELDRALRRAAARKVEVRLLVADWSTRKGKLAALQSLDVLDHLSVKVLTVPEHSGGPIEFARVIHAKYMTVDGAWSWVGTSNWSRDYFENSRDVGLTVGSAAFAQDLDRVFERLWASAHAKAAVDFRGGD